eukprot:GHVL01026947.1.p1 GENE.GHVL01026947.1~~GHVL01026947.1.p1  ORF type:complete len:426 (+),score=124.78 GHVL01026947.1:213-1490(+)
MDQSEELNLLTWRSAVAEKKMLQAEERAARIREPQNSAIDGGGDNHFRFPPPPPTVTYQTNQSIVGNPSVLLRRSNQTSDKHQSPHIHPTPPPRGVGAPLVPIILSQNNLFPSCIQRPMGGRVIKPMYQHPNEHQTQFISSSAMASPSMSFESFVPWDRRMNDHIYQYKSKEDLQDDENIDINDSRSTNTSDRNYFTVKKRQTIRNRNFYQQPTYPLPQGCQPQGCQPQGCQPQGCQPQVCQPQVCQPQGSQPQGCQPQGCPYIDNISSPSVLRHHVHQGGIERYYSDNENSGIPIPGLSTPRQRGTTPTRNCYTPQAYPAVSTPNRHPHHMPPRVPHHSTGKTIWLTAHRQHSLTVSPRDNHLSQNKHHYWLSPSGSNPTFNNPPTYEKIENLPSNSPSNSPLMKDIFESVNPSPIDIRYKKHP